MTLSLHSKHEKAERYTRIREEKGKRDAKLHGACARQVEYSPEQVSGDASSRIDTFSKAGVLATMTLPDGLAYDGRNGSGVKGIGRISMPRATTTQLIDHQPTYAWPE